MFVNYLTVSGLVTDSIAGFDDARKGGDEDVLETGCGEAGGAEAGDPEARGADVFEMGSAGGPLEAGGADVLEGCDSLEDNIILCDCCGHRSSVVSKRSDNLLWILGDHKTAHSIDIFDCNRLGGNGKW